MKQFAVIGLDNFGRRVLDELLEAECELLIIDKDEEVINLYKDRVMNAYIADVLNEETIRKVVPKTLDAAVVDLGDNIEASILVTNYLKKMGIQIVIVKAESRQHAEILELVGASRVVFPNKEAAKRITPLLLSSLIFSYLPISEDFIIAEIKVPAKYLGKTLLEINLRKMFGLNVIALRKEDTPSYTLFSPDHILKSDEIFLIGGREEDIISFAEVPLPEGKKGIKGFFKRFFSRSNKNGDK
ncbi:MAG: TrkA family potassium uptake protein [Spirochaetales bacterium]|nr:TrkA family potassium uptake protein [Spirochaetales bacterium]